jgi:hypothetical protein
VKPAEKRSNDPGAPQRGSQTALISLGIPKLVRFAVLPKSALKRQKVY